MPLTPAQTKALTKAASKLTAAHQERDRLIREAVAAGAGVREVARAVGLTHPGVLAIIKREAPR